WFALIALAALVDVVMRLRAPVPHASRGEHEEAFARLAIARPATWSRAAVDERLQELHRERAEIERERESRAHVERLKRRQAELDVECLELERERSELEGSLGTDLPKSDVVLSVLA